MSTLSQGPYNYNRFAAIDDIRQQEKMYFTEKAKEKKAKPDFLDVDGDGDKEESFKKGVKDKEKGDDKKEGKGGLPDFLKKKKDMKEGKCSSGCDCDDCKKSKKKAMTEWIEELVQEGYDLSEYNMEQMEEMYDVALAEALEDEQPTIQEAVCQYLIDNGFANNTVSAEVLFSNMSEGWRNSVANEIAEGFKPLPVNKMARQAGKAYGKERAAAASGNEKEANKQMQRGIAMKDPSGRKTILSKR